MQSIGSVTSAPQADSSYTPSPRPEVAKVGPNYIASVVGEAVDFSLSLSPLEPSSHKVDAYA